MGSRKPRFQVVEAPPMMLMPPAPGLCQVCAAEHDPPFPHNPQSLYWGVARQMAGLPPPTWSDAIAHCTPEAQAIVRKALADHGIVVA